MEYILLKEVTGPGISQKKWKLMVPEETLDSIEEIKVICKMLDHQFTWLFDDDGIASMVYCIFDSLKNPIVQLIFNFPYNDTGNCYFTGLDIYYFRDKNGNFIDTINPPDEYNISVDGFTKSMEELNKLKLLL